MVSFAVGNLTPGTVYYYYVQAFNATNIAASDWASSRFATSSRLRTAYVSGVTVPDAMASPSPTHASMTSVSRSPLTGSAENAIAALSARTSSWTRTATRGLSVIPRSFLYATARSDEADPAAVFEQRWASTLLQTVLSRLRNEFVMGGRVDLPLP